MNFKDLIKESSDIEQKLSALEQSMKPLLDRRNEIKNELLTSMKELGVKRVEHDTLGIQVVFSVRKSLRIANDVQAIATLSSNNISREMYTNPDKRKMIELLRGLQEKGVEVKCLEPRETESLSFRKSNEKDSKK